jgi:hypothetical protein
MLALFPVEGRCMEGVLVGPGAVLAGRYTIERELGRGGMATVYLAQDLRHHRAVAVKVLRPEFAAYLGSDRFLREIEIAARLTHPHILPLHDSGEAGEFLYYIMPFVEGESLRERLVRDGPLPLEDAVRIAREVADALAYAHAHGVVHRDIKPGNILLESGHAVVADFGIAHAVSKAGGEDFTTSGLAIGTPMYMSPEQWLGTPVDGRSDLYSLGCVLYEMLTGRVPFAGPTPKAVAARHLHEQAPSLESMESIPEPVARVVETALEKDREARFQSAGEFVQALTGAVPYRSPDRLSLRARRVAAMILLAAIVAVAGLALSRGSTPLDPERIVIYPVAATAAKSAVVTPEEVTLALLASLNSSASITGIDGGRLQGYRSGDAGEGAGDRLTRRQGAAFYVDARLLTGDSLHLVLDLHDVRGGPVAHRVLDFAPGTTGWSIGIRAALELLPLLIRTGRPPELPSLVGRSPAALAEYFLGERDYRRAAFTAATEHFQRAVAADSGFALAAVRGAQAATWDSRPTVAEAFVRVALEHEAVLPARQRVFAHGFDAWLKGSADSARQRFLEAVALDPTAAEPWLGLGETYNHLLPRAAPLDTLAEAAYQQVHKLDSTFAPALFHLTEFAVRRGDRQQAAALLAQYRRIAPQADGLRAAELLLACAQNRISREGWRAAARLTPRPVFEAGQSLALAGLRQPACAEAAWAAVLSTDPAGEAASYRFGAMLGLYSLLVAESRDDEARVLLEGDSLFRPALRGQLYILAALAGADFTQEANGYVARAMRLYRSDPDNVSNIEVWFLGSWLAHTGDAAEAGVMARLIESRAAKGDGRRDSLLAASLRARAILVSGDTTEALRQLRSLTATARSQAELTWNPWESLPGERLLLAQVLLRRDRMDEAFQVASNFDSPVPIVYLMYLPASLSLRIHAAEQLGEPRLAQLSRTRLARLRSAKIVPQ